MIRYAALLLVPLLALPATTGPSQEEYVNAGVMAYTMEPGEITLLLGFDGEESHWSDFVGVCTPGERPRDTAARQFEEETRGAYPMAEITRMLQGAAPVVIGETRIFLLEVPPVSAVQLGRLAKDRGYEKTDYCWVPLSDLLASVDERGPNRAQVPASCIADSRRLFNLVGRNLAQGQEMRQRLLSPDQGASVTPMGMSPRCGR